MCPLAPEEPYMDHGGELSKRREWHVQMPWAGEDCRVWSHLKDRKRTSVWLRQGLGHREGGRPVAVGVGNQVG